MFFYRKLQVFKLHVKKLIALLTFDLNIKALKHLKCVTSNVVTLELLYDCSITECWQCQTLELWNY